MADLTFVHFLWAVALGGVSAVSLPLGSLIGLRIHFSRKQISALAAFGAGALIAALSIELVAPTCLALSDTGTNGLSSPVLTNFLALIFGGALGGALFVALDSLVNPHGGYLRKRSATLAHSAARQRADAHRQLAGILETKPFDALPPELTATLAGMLSFERFKQHEVVADPENTSHRAYIVLKGEFEFEIDGQDATTAGPRTLMGLLLILVPELDSLVSIRARTEVECLVLDKHQLRRLRSLSPAFDQACRTMAVDRIQQLEQHVVTRLSKAVEWTHRAADALQAGAELPTLTVRRDHREHQGSPMAVWLGILLDGIPESLVIGAGLHVMLMAQASPESLTFTKVIPYTLIAGLFLSNFPEALASSVNMLAAGLSSRRIFLMWLAIMVTTAIGAGAGFLLAGVLSQSWLVFAQGIAAGAMLTMIAAAMIPDAATHGGTPNVVGLSTLAGFLFAVLFKLLE